MVNKDKENRQNHSTVNILNSLKEEELPDASLSPDSPVRKKRETERFDALLFAAFIESIRIKKIIYAHWKLLLEKTNKKFAMERKAYLEKFKNIRIIIIRQSQLSDKQLAKIHSINKWFHNLIKKLDDKINHVNQKIAEQNTQISILKQERIELQTALAHAWQAQTASMPVPKSINIPFNLPSQYQYYAKRDELEEYVRFNSNDITTILSDIGNDLQSKTFSLFGLQDIIQESVLNCMRKKLEVDWFFLPKNERESAINLRIQEPDVQQLLTEPILKLVNQDPIIKDRIKELYAHDKKIAHATVVRDIYMAYRDVLIDKRAFLDKKCEQYTAQVSEQLTTQPAESSANQGDKNIDNLLIAHSNNLAIVENAMGADDEALYQTVAELDFTSKAADNVFDNISNDDDKMDETQLKIEKGQEFIQSIEKEDEEIEIEITHSLTLPNRSNPF